MTQRGTALKKLADAAGPLYKSLDEGQKHRLVMLAHLEGRHGDGERGPDGRRGMGGWMHRGQGGPERGPMGPEGGPRPQ
jgi:zinc resistance-associated protein